MTVDNQNQSSNEGGEQQDSMNFARLKEKYESQISELQEKASKFEGVARMAAFEKAGLNPEEGLGKAIYRTYEGEIDPEQIQQFAVTEYNWEPPKPKAVSESQQRMDSIMGMGAAPEPADEASKIAEAERAGDWTTAMALKDQQLRRVSEARFGY